MPCGLRLLYLPFRMQAASGCILAAARPKSPPASMPACIGGRPPRPPGPHPATGTGVPVRDAPSHNRAGLRDFKSPTLAPCLHWPTVSANGFQDAPGAARPPQRAAARPGRQPRPPRGRHAPGPAAVGQSRPRLRMWRHREPAAQRKAGHCPRNKDGGDGSRRTWAGGLARKPQKKAGPLPCLGGTPPLVYRSRIYCW